VAKNAPVLRVRQVRSTIGQTRKQREALRTLGLHRIGHVVELPDNPAVQGNVRLIGHLVRVEDEPAAVIEAAPKTTVTSPAPKAAKKTAKKTAKKAAKKTAKKTVKKAATKAKTSKATKAKTATKKKTTKKKASGGKS
jgi:ribosomal protein L30